MTLIESGSMNFRYVLALLLIPLVAHAMPPTGERLEQAIVGALAREPTRKTMTNLTTTLVDAVDVDNPNKLDSGTQLFVVTNLDSANLLCFGTIPLLTTETCDETLCDTAAKWTNAVDAATPGNAMAGKGNCTIGNASMISPIPFGQSREFRYQGNRCGCIVAAAASTDVMVERVSR